MGYKNGYVRQSVFIYTSLVSLVILLSSSKNCSKKGLIKLLSLQEPLFPLLVVPIQ